MTEDVWGSLDSHFSQGHSACFDKSSSALLREIFKPRTIKKDGYFLNAGDKSTEIGYVRKGLFRSFYIDRKGQDVTKYFYPEGSTLFSYVAHLSGKESSYDIQALEDSELLVAKISDFESIVEGNYQLLWLYKKMIDKILVVKEEHAMSFKLLNSTERYKQFLEAYPGLEQRVKQYQLASYLGITPVSLSRIRNKLNLNK
ncbi:MAG: Crp/Fnr family transcriptional regulator [Clostridia bacterium]|nr:Crp/Fnr family transcriptional regulator [Clostridia bacterium]